jgi:hypothetical protein
MKKFNKNLLIPIAFFLTFGVYAATEWGNLLIKGNLTVAGTSTVTGASTINGANLNFGTASNTNRLLLPKDTTSNLDALTDTASLFAFDTTLNKPVFNDGSGWQEVGSGSGGSSGINLLSESNANAEDGVSTPWTETGGGTLTVTSTAANVGNGTYAFSYDSSANNDTADSPAITIPAGLFGQNCLLEFRYKGFGTSTSFQVYDGTTVLDTYAVPSAASSYRLVQRNFTCPTSGTLQMRIAASGDDAIGYWDEVHLGSANNIGSTGIVTDLGTSTWTDNQANSTTSVTLVRVGPTIFVDGITSFTGAMSGGFTVTVPAAYTAASNPGSEHNPVGYAYGSTTSHNPMRVAFQNDANTLLFYVTDTSTSYGSFANTSSTIPGTWANGHTLRWRAQWRVSGWSATGSSITDQSVRTPTVQRFTSSGACTYTRPAGVTHIVVEMAGGGGGGGGSGTAAGTAGTAGGNTTFGTSLLTANGGSVGAWNGGGAGGAGGSATVNSPAVTLVANTGGAGGGSLTANSEADFTTGGYGGQNMFGGGGTSGAAGAAGGVAVANTGGGGGGAGGPNSATGAAGPGGGAGGYIKALIVNPSSSYSCNVGAFGDEEEAGTSGAKGGDGADGIIVVTEYYGQNMPILIGNNTQYTLTVSGQAGWTTVRAVGIPYLTSDSGWRLKFNIIGTLTAASSITSLAVTGVTFKDASSTAYQAVTAYDISAGNLTTTMARTDPGTNEFNIQFSGNSTQMIISGDVELDSKPTFVP